MRLLFKVGSALISKDNHLDHLWLESKVAELSDLHRKGHEVVLVSSGAVAAGMEVQGATVRPREVLRLQMLSGEGQIMLMKTYKDLFASHDIRVAQVLLTHHSFAVKHEERTVRQIMNSYLTEGVVPVINENDLVNKEEFDYERMFTDNDILAALVGVALAVDVAVLLTDVDGLYRENPKVNREAQLIERVELIDERVRNMGSQDTNALGLGGMRSKVRAAEMMTAHGIDVMVANGRLNLRDVLEGKARRTLFCRRGSEPRDGVRV
jgi:glutamate 5-kinase